MEKQAGQALSRFKNKQWLNKKKADTRMGGLRRMFKTDTEGKCCECERKIYFTDKEEDINDMVEENYKTICPVCTYKNHKETLNPEQLEFIKEIAENDLERL